MAIIDIKKLSYLRKKKNLSQAELARRSGVERSTIHNIEKGNINPSLPLAAKIAFVLNCSVDDLIFFGNIVDSKGTERGDQDNVS